MDKIQLYVNDVLVFNQSASGPVPIPPEPTPIPPTPIPPQGDGLDAFRARQRVSQNCAWVLTTSAESGALSAKLGASYHQYVQFYTVGGTGSVAPQEMVNPASPSGYSFWTVDQQLRDDVNQAADAYVVQRCQEQQIPGPPSPAVV